MESKELERVIEAVVFASGEQIDRADIMGKLEVTEDEFNAAVGALKEKYNGETSGVVLLEFGTKLQFATESSLVEDVMKVICPIRERALTKSTIETLSIIAYKQPITRLEIEEIRGVASDYALGVLMDHKLIEVVGKKDAVGRPLLFGTTDEFLKRFNLGSTDDLPNKAELMDRIKTLRQGTDSDGTSLYRKFDVSSEEIIPEKVLESIKLSQSLSAADESVDSSDDFV